MGKGRKRVLEKGNFRKKRRAEGKEEDKIQWAVRAT